MKLKNEGAMYIVIYISLSFHETLSFSDENDYFDSDLIPFISIKNKKANRSLENRENSINFKMNSQSTYSNSHLHVDPHVSITTIKRRYNNSTARNVRKVFYSGLYDQLPTTYKLFEESIKKEQESSMKWSPNKDDIDILTMKKNDFLNEKANQNFSSYTTSDFKLTEKLNFLNKTNSLQNYDRSTNENNNSDKFTNFFDSLLSLLSYLSPDLLNVLNENIKRFQMYNVIKRDSVSNDSPYQSHEISSTLKTILCNCDYCRTGKPDTALYIVSGKRLNNSVTYHKLTSVNRSKSKTSSRYQLQTANDNDSNGPLESRYLPANYDRTIFGNSFDTTINEKIIDSYEMTNGSHNQVPMMTSVPVSRNHGKRLMSAYNGLRNLGFYKPFNNKINVSLNFPLTRLIEPDSHKYKRIVNGGSNTLSNQTKSKNNEERQYNGTYYKKDHVELFSSIDFNTLNDWKMRDSDENQIKKPLNHDERKNEYIFEDKISINRSQQITGERNNDLSVKTDTYKNIDTHMLNSVVTESSYNDANSLTNGVNYNSNTFNPDLSKGIIKNNYTENIFYNINFKNSSTAAVDGIAALFSPTVPTKKDFDVAYDINEDYKDKQASDETNTVTVEHNRFTEPLQRSMFDTINKLMDNVEARTLNETKHMVKTTYATTQGYGGNNRSNNNDFKNISLEMHPDKHENSRAFSEQPSLFDSTFQKTEESVEPSVITTIVTTTKTLNNAVNKKETYVNYDLNLRNLIGESNIDDKIMCT